MICSVIRFPYLHLAVLITRRPFHNDKQAYRCLKSTSYGFYLMHEKATSRCLCLTETPKPANPDSSSLNMVSLTELYTVFLTKIYRYTYF